MQICNCLKTIGSYCPEAKQAMEKKKFASCFWDHLDEVFQNTFTEPKKKASRVLRPRHSKEFAPRNSSRRFSARLKGGFPVTPSIADNKPVGSIKGILGVGEDSHRLQVKGKIIVPQKMQAKLKVMPPHGTFTPSMSTTNLRG